MKQIEWLSKGLRREYRAALFDFDGTISLLREGWQPIMYTYFAQVLEEFRGGDSKEEIRTLVEDFVDQLTGKQTIYQCIYLVEEVQRRGGKPLEASFYKDEYSRRLLKAIDYRVKGLKAGTIRREDYLVPGSVELLEALRSQGLILYLASGTDHEYVVAEAEALGVDHYFNGGIYGAVEDYENFSKEQVIRDLILPKIASGETLLGFGDGFVEIENVKAVGGTAVGVASNEKERQGIDPWKQKRLTLAGSDVIIGDYICLDLLLGGLLGGYGDDVSNL